MMVPDHIAKLLDSFLKRFSISTLIKIICTDNLIKILWFEIWKHSGHHLDIFCHEFYVQLPDRNNIKIASTCSVTRSWVQTQGHHEKEQEKARRKRREGGRVFE